MKKQLWALILAALFSLASISAASAAPGLQGGGLIHYVGFGETLSTIAAQYGVPAEVILRHNGLANPNLIYVGQPLIIPGGGGYGAGFGGYGGCGDAHTVVAGETLSSIAYRYGVSLEALIQRNNLYNSDIVYVGQRICLPSRGGYAPQPASYQNYNPAGSFYHTVATGETLFGIADRYRCSYADIMRLNSMQNASFITVGQRLLIPPPGPIAHAAPAAPAGPHYGPPPAPAYNDSYDQGHHKPPIEKHPPKEPQKASYEGVPAPPDYQAGPSLPILPVADHPLEVVVNGGMNWVGEPYPSWPDPNGITTLIVNTTGETTPVVWLRSGDYEVKGTLGFEPEFGIDRPRFVFRYIPPGDYDVWLADPEGTPVDKQTPSQVVRVKVEPGRRVEVAFRLGLLFSGPQFTSPDGWFLADWSNPSVPKQNLGGWSNILIKTPASGLNILIESEGGGYKAKCFTGSKGPGACDFAGLNAGLYFIKIDGTQYTVKTYMDGNAYATFTFARQPTGKDENKVGPVSYD